MAISVPCEQWFTVQCDFPDADVDPSVNCPHCGGDWRELPCEYCGVGLTGLTPRPRIELSNGY